VFRLMLRSAPRADRRGRRGRGLGR
jgi:hypothetical protein